MFKNLTKYSHERNFIEAVGFFIAYLFLGMIIGGIVGIIATNLVKDPNHFQVGVKAGSIFAVIYCPLLAYFIVKEKKIYSQFGVIVLFLLSILLAMVLGSLGGLIPVSVLSALKSKKDEEIVELDQKEE